MKQQYFISFALSLILLSGCTWLAVKQRAEDAKTVVYGGKYTPPVTADGVTKDIVILEGLFNSEGGKKAKSFIELLHPLAGEALGILAFITAFALGKEPEDE